MCISVGGGGGGGEQERERERERSVPKQNKKTIPKNSQQY